MKLVQWGINCLWIMVLWQVNLNAQADIPEQMIETKIEKVKLHLQAAEVHRSKKVNIQKGRSLIIFTGLSSKLYPQTIQMTIDNPSISILSVTSKLNHLAKTGEDKKNIIFRDSIAQIRKIIRDLEDETAAYIAEAEVLKYNKGTKGHNQELDLELLKATSTYHRKRTLEINRAISKLQAKIVAENRRLFDYKLQLHELNASKQATSEIYLVVEASQASNINIDLNYVVYDCGWAAIYDLESQNFSNKIELSYRALAFNDTGIDWNNIKLTLATSDPLKNANYPILATWNIADYSSAAINAMIDLDLKQKKYVQEKSLMPHSTTNKVQAILGDDYKAGIDYETERYKEYQSNQENRPQLTSATLDVPEFNVDFEIDKPYSIPADKKPYSIDVKKHELAATYKYYAVPKMDKDAFLLAQVVGWEDLNLISGSVNIYNAKRYVGQSFLNIRNISDTLQISLGRDKNIVINRTKVKGKTRRQLLGGSTKKASFAYEIDVRNNHKKVIDIEIIDQIPFSTDKEIVVTLDEKGNADYYESTAELTWRFQLEGSKTKKLEFGYSIKYPKSKKVNIQYRKSRQIQQERYF